MIKINGDEITERQIEYGLVQFNSDLTVRVMPCDDKEDAERLAKAMGGRPVVRNVYFGDWQSVTYPL